MFIYKQWDEFCKGLKDNNIVSITATEALECEFSISDKQFIILKHDVETNLIKALHLAEIEYKYSHKGSYYVQAYLLDSKKNISILNKIKEFGHEVTYHYDVLDHCKGDMRKAELEFGDNLRLFEDNGFSVKTVCQHGNPIVNRNGYNSNRDFFRNINVANHYHKIKDIMVNYKDSINREYLYISDAGYGWKIIFDPENNDIVKSDNLNIHLKNLDDVIELIVSGKSVILSTHPHRWSRNVAEARIKNMMFKTIKTIAKSVIKLSFMNRFLSKYYYLAKKI